jgi:hypothetical protein
MRKPPVPFSTDFHNRNSTISYWMVGLQPKLFNFLIFLLTTILMALAGQSYGLMLGCIVVKFPSCSESSSFMIFARRLMPAPPSPSLVSNRHRHRRSCLNPLLSHGERPAALSHRLVPFRPSSRSCYSPGSSLMSNRSRLGLVGSSISVLSRCV